MDYSVVIVSLSNCFHPAYNHHLQSDTSKAERLPRRHELLITETIYGGTTKEWLLEAQEQEKWLAYQDKQMEQTKDKKNALEAYVYEIRNKVTSNLVVISSYVFLVIKLIVLIFFFFGLILLMNSFLRDIEVLQMIPRGKEFLLAYNRLKNGFMKMEMMKLKRFTPANSMN